MKKLKLTQIANAKLANKELKNVTGGKIQACGSTNGCGCGCIWEGTPGGSSSFVNLQANFNLGISTHEHAQLAI